jgi:succinyl-CoA synthetase beta subunit
MEVKDALKDEFDDEIVGKIVEISGNCWEIAQEKEALLVEINPLMLTKDNKVFAGDAKIVLDDNAGYRHEDMWKYKQSKRSIAEDQSHEKGIPFVELDGEIGVIGNGAGLVMATLDMINEFGGTPANFLDIGGGASKEKTLEALEIVLKSEKPKGLIVNIFGGITHCDTVAQAIVESVKEMGREIPIVIRMVGTNEKQAEEILDKAGIHFYTSMEKAVKKIISLIKET